jgi:hypothetical protein
MFGLQVHATILAGCVTLIMAVSLYSTARQKAGAVASRKCRAVVAMIMFSFFALGVFAKNVMVDS